MRKRPYRFAAAAIAAGALLVAPAAGAFGQEPNPQETVGTESQANEANPALINAGATTQLSIHKYLGSATGQPNDGTIQTVNRPALQGVDFDVYLVEGVDLTTNAGWEAARAISGYRPTAAEIAAGSFTIGGTTYTLAEPETVTTDATGSAALQGEVGLYFVVENLETSDTITYVDDEGETVVVPATTIIPAQPFFVTLPMTHPTNRDSWMYDVHVYPKNAQKDEPHKAVFDEDSVEVGDEIIYRVSGNVPDYGDVVGPLDDDGNYTGPDGVYNHLDLQYFYVQDTFDGNLTVLDPPIGGVWVVARDADPTLPTTPRLVELVAADYEVTVTGQTVRVTLTDTGLDKIATRPGDQVVVDFRTELASVPEGGVIENTAYVVPGSRPDSGSAPETPREPTPDDETNEVVDKYGKIRIEKTGVNGSAEQPLSGVVFEIYRATLVDDDGDVTTAPVPQCIAADFVADNLVGGFTTGEGGVGESEWLRLSTWYNDGVEQSDSPLGANDGYLDGAQYATKYGFQDYCLVETETVDGYQLLAEPIQVRLDVEGDVVGTEYTPIDVVNQSDNLGNSLPLTGGAGVAGMSIIGLLLVGGGLAYTMKNRRREDVNA
ncbi:MAG: SpaH/EbpB family LPXTG-anchored major pilin [Actinomycetia bacterium]|nr:SpaH/EbpB family LPXTG-anchored major pilin [Actinomycetes bacterium]